jgi:hypothetical protein
MLEQPEHPRNSSPDDRSAPFPIPNPPIETGSPDPRIEDYLDHVCAPLVGVVPYARRQELRAELREHLAALAAAQQEMGSEPDAAAVMALRQFGEPRDLSRQWAQEWLEGSGPACIQSPWRAMLVALGCFGLAMLMGFATCLIGRLPIPMPMSLIIGPVLTTAIATALPLMAGVASGWLAPARQALGAFYALAVLLPSVVLVLYGQIQVSDYPDNYMRSGALWAMWPLLGWMPIGCGGAAFGAWLRQVLPAKPRRWVLQ